MLEAILAGLGSQGQESIRFPEEFQPNDYPWV